MLSRYYYKKTIRNTIIKNAKKNYRQFMVVLRHPVPLFTLNFCYDQLHISHHASSKTNFHHSHYLPSLLSHSIHKPVSEAKPSAINTSSEPTFQPIRGYRPTKTVVWQFTIWPPWLFWWDWSTSNHSDTISTYTIDNWPAFLSET